MSAKSFRELVGAPASTASPKDSALVIVDAQNEYAEGKLKVTNAPASRKVIASLVDKYRQGGGNIIHVLHDTPDGAPVFTPKTSLAEEYSELKPKDGEKIIHKQHPSSFSDTDSNQHLKDKGINKIVLTGYMAHVCVSSTARDGARYGYEVVVAADGIGDRDIPGASGDEVTKMVLNELGDAFATIVQSSEIA